MKPSKYNLEKLVKLLVITVLQSKNLKFWLSSNFKETQQRLEVCFSDLESFNSCKEEVSANDLAKLLTLLLKDNFKVKFSINKNFLFKLPRANAEAIKKKFYFTKPFNPEKYLLRIANGLAGRKPSPLAVDLKVHQLHQEAELAYQFYLDNLEKDLFLLSIEYLSQLDNIDRTYLEYIKTFNQQESLSSNDLPKVLMDLSLLDARLLLTQEENSNSYTDTLLSPLMDSGDISYSVFENQESALDSKPNNLVQTSSALSIIDSSIDKVDSLINRSRLTLQEPSIPLEDKGRALKSFVKQAKVEISQTENIIRKNKSLDLESIFILEDKKFQINEISKNYTYNQTAFSTASTLSIAKDNVAIHENGFFNILFSDVTEDSIKNQTLSSDDLSQDVSIKENLDKTFISGFSSEFLDSSATSSYPEINTALDANKYVVSGSDNGITENGEIIPLNSDRAIKLKFYGCDLHNYKKLDDFIISSFNSTSYSFLHSYAEKICKEKTFASKVLYLYGNSGVGKTQMCQQILANLQEANLNYKEMYFYSNFKKTFSAYACQNKLDRLKEELLSRKINVIDGWDSLTDKSKEFICNLVEDFQASKNKVLIVIGKEKPHSILAATSYTGSKFSAVEQVLLGLPDAKFREFLLKYCLSKFNVTLSSHNLARLIEASEGRGIGECISFVKELAVGLYSFEQLLDTRMRKTVAVAIDVKTVISLIKEVTGITFEQLTAKNRKKETTFYRMLAVYALSQLGDYSISAIARTLGQANSTIRNSLSRAKVANHNNEHYFVSLYSQIKARAHEEYLNSFK